MDIKRVKASGDRVEQTGIKRRDFLAKSAAAAVAAGATGAAGFARHSSHAAEPLVKGMPNTEKLGWRVGFATYSFRSVTIYEAIEKTAATGLHYAELFAWQKLSPAHPDVTPEKGLSKILRNELKKKAADSGVKLIGMYSRMKDPDATKAEFEFAADMGFEFIVGEPQGAMMDEVDGLTKESGIDLALHNHPKPSYYWNPDTGLAALKDRSGKMGLCCDTGHWCRSGLDPVEMLRKVAPRVKTFHLKDLEAFGVLKSEDAIWGKGKCRIADILAEVKKQDIQHPYFSIEWERNPDEPLETHAASAAFFEQVARGLVAS